MKKMNLEKTIKKIEAGLKEYAGNRKAIIGISGGIDSAVVAGLCTRALGKENIYGILMPYGNQNTECARLVVDYLRIANQEINIKNIVDSFNFLKLNKLSKGNIMARMRMIILYGFANEFKGLVVGTGNKSECEVGYFTKYGDGGVDLQPIADLYKTEIFEVAKILGLPKKIVEKIPSADLYEGQTDEGEIGATYKEIDAVLKGKIKKGRVYEKIQARRIATEHKRKMPLIIKVKEEK